MLVGTNVAHFYQRASVSDNSLYFSYGPIPTQPLSCQQAQQFDSTGINQTDDTVWLIIIEEGLIVW